MKRTAIVLAVGLLLPAGNLFAQGDQIEHAMTGCIKAGQAPLMQVSVEPKGELRAYFRRVNTTDWCSVLGKNLGPLSNVVLPKFEKGDEIEYFFVVLEGKRVIAKSPRVYRAKATDGCENDVARHMMDVSIDCSRVDDVIPAALEAAYKVPVSAAPPFISAERPTQQ
jgi:hypothetical protein